VQIDLVLNLGWGWVGGGGCIPNTPPHNWCLEKLTSGFGGHLIHINSASSKAKQEVPYTYKRPQEALHLLLGVTW